MTMETPIWEGNISLLGGLEHEFYFSIQLGRIIPTDELHDFSEG